MEATLIIQGRPVAAPELESIRQWLGENPHWSRWRLSRELAQRWDWRNGEGQLKDMAARTLLVKLEQRGLIELPPRRQVPTNRMRCDSVVPGVVEAPPQPIECTLEQLGELQVREVSSQGPERCWVKAALGQFHYLGFGGTVGENLQYVVRDGQGGPLGCLVFGAAAWKCQGRDQFIGWSAQQRTDNLRLIANNHRFLILPRVATYYDTSSVLGCQSNSDCCCSAGGTDDPACTFSTAA